jgi:UDP:flavonoid glycosyltransferase YjiC (YdhE family)
MGEAVYLRRPMLAVPIAGQFEQVLNARYLAREGYGLDADEISDARLGQFIEALPEFERNLGLYRQDGNRDLLASLDKTLAAAVAPRSRWRREG